MNTAVAFIYFNRVTQAVQTAAAIASFWRGPVICISDGARDNRGEGDVVSNCRKSVEFTLKGLISLKIYSDVNLGCRRRIQSGLDEAFRYYDQIIVIEDDCLPNEHFFNFCVKGLSLMRREPLLFAVSGTNFSRGSVEGPFASKWFGIWGWATNRASWVAASKYRFRSLAEVFLLTQKIQPCMLGLYLLIGLIKVYRRKIDSWDYEWMAGALAEGGYCLFPPNSLITNTGLGVGATNSKKEIYIPEAKAYVWADQNVKINNNYHMLRLMNIVLNKFSF